MKMNIGKFKLLSDKRGWVTRDFVIAGLLFTGIIAMFVLFIAGMSAEYNQPDLVSSSFSSNYNKLEEISNKVEVMRATTATGEGLSLIGAFDIAFTATFTVIQLVFSTLALAGSLPFNIVKDFDLPFINDLVTNTFFILGLAIITTTIIFVWISSVSRGKI